VPSMPATDMGERVVGPPFPLNASDRARRLSAVE
jgi:hypothetical protein